MDKRSETAKDKKATIGFASIELADDLRKSSFSGDVAPANGSGLMRWGHSECSKGVCNCKRIFRTNQPGALLEEEFDMQKREGRRSLQKQGRIRSRAHVEAGL